MVEQQFNKTVFSKSSFASEGKETKVGKERSEKFRVTFGQLDEHKPEDNKDKSFSSQAKNVTYPQKPKNYFHPIIDNQSLESDNRIKSANDAS